MSYIPDCRPKYKADCARLNIRSEEHVDEKEINPYWYGLLRGDNAEFLRGYDYNTMLSINNLFDNLDIYDELLNDVGIDVNEIDTDVVNGAYLPLNIHLPYLHASASDEVKEYDDYDQEELKKMNHSTRVMLLIKSIINDYIESERDMLVTSMIDEMNDEEHEKAMKEAQDKEV